VIGAPQMFCVGSFPCGRDLGSQAVYPVRLTELAGESLPIPNG